MNSAKNEIPCWWASPTWRARTTRSIYSSPWSRTSRRKFSSSRTASPSSPPPIRSQNLWPSPQRVMSTRKSIHMSMTSTRRSQNSTTGSSSSTLLGMTPWPRRPTKRSNNCSTSADRLSNSTSSSRRTTSRPRRRPASGRIRSNSWRSTWRTK